MRKVSFVVFCIIFSLTCSSQTVRYLKGMKSLDAEIGVVNSGYGYSLGLNNVLNSHSFVAVDGNYFHGETGYTKFERFALNTRYSYNFYTIKNIVYFSLSPGVLFGYEKLDNEIEKEEKFIYSINVTGEIEIIISSKLSISCQSQYHRYIKTNLNKDGYFLSAGIRKYL